MAPIDDTPTAEDQGVDVVENTSVTITLNGDADDPEIVQPLTCDLVSSPTHGTIQNFNPATGELLYTPDENYNGDDSFTFTTSDGEGRTSDPATVSISIAAVNDAPTVTSQTVSTLQGTSLTITLIGDDGDPELDQALQYAIANGPSNGTITGFNRLSGELTYTPNTNFFGTDSFTFTLKETVADLTTEPATVTIDVLPTNEVPIANPQSVDTPEDTPLAVTLTGDDGDPEVAQTLTFAIVEGPTAPSKGSTQQRENWSTRPMRISMAATSSPSPSPTTPLQVVSQGPVIRSPSRSKWCLSMTLPSLRTTLSPYPSLTS